MKEFQVLNLLLRPSLKVTLTLLAISVCTGCQSLMLASRPQAPELIPPQASAVNLQLNQRLLIRDPDGQKQQMLAVTTISPKILRLNGLSITGQRLLELRWDGKTLETWQAPEIERDVPAVWLLAQIQLAYLPEAVLRRHYTGDWTLQTETGKRHLLLEGKSNITVTCRAPFSGGRDCLVPDTSVLIDHYQSGLFVKVDALKVTEGGAGQPSKNASISASKLERSKP